MRSGQPRPVAALRLFAPRRPGVREQAPFRPGLPAAGPQRKPPPTMQRGAGGKLPPARGAGKLPRGRAASPPGPAALAAVPARPPSEFVGDVARLRGTRKVPALGRFGRPRPAAGGPRSAANALPAATRPPHQPDSVDIARALSSVKAAVRPRAAPG